MAAGKSGNEQKKLIAASVLLGLALIWIAFYSLSGGKKAPKPAELPPEQAQKLEEQHEQEVKKVKDEQKAANRNRPVAPPSGS